MTKGARITVKVLLIVAAVLVGLVLLVEILLLTPILPNAVDKYASKALKEGVVLSHGGIKASLLKEFPRISLSLDSLSVTYPHDLYSSHDAADSCFEWGGLGRGEDADTLARFDNLHVSVNLWWILAGKIRIHDITLDGLGLYARAYDDTTANWQVFAGSGEEKAAADTSRKSDLTVLNRLRVGKLCIAGAPHVVYSSTSSKLEAFLNLRELSLTGVAPRSLDLLLDSCRVSVAGHFGKVNVPADLKTDISYLFGKEESKVGIDSLDASLAYIPLAGKGEIRLPASDSPRIDASLRVKDCPLDSLIRNYAQVLVPKTKGLSTDALLSLSADAKGVLSSEKWPETSLSLSLPQSNVSYSPMKLDAKLTLDAAASATEDKYVGAEIRNLCLIASGVDLDMSAAVKDVLGKNPAISMTAGAKAQLESIAKYLPSSFKAKMAGKVDLSLSADLTKEQLDKYDFRNSSLSGHLKGEKIIFDIPGDSVKMRAFNPDITLNSNDKGLAAGVMLDSVYYTGGVTKNGRIRDLKTTAHLYAVETGGAKVPRIDATLSSSRLFFRANDNRMGVRNAEVSATVRKKGIKDLQADNAEVREDELKDKGNFQLALDSTVTAYFKDWVPSITLKMDKGFYASPQLPLRTRLKKFSATYSRGNLKLDTLSMTCGTSDVALKGTLKGLDKALAGKKAFYDANVWWNSSRVNVNELISAAQVGKKQKADTTVAAESYEGFVTDTLADKRLDSIPMFIVILPGNVKASLTASVQHLDIQGVGVSPLTGRANLRDRTIQLDNIAVKSTLGNIGLNAYYFTHSMKDIGLGLDLDLEDMSAKNIIEILPPVDTIMPLLKTFTGNLGLKLSLTTKIDSTMNLIVPTLDGMLQVSGKDLHIANAGKLTKFTRLAMFRNPNIGHIDDLYASAVVHNGKIEVFPFELGVDRYKLVLRGLLNKDQTMYYNISFLKSPIPFRFGINIYGVPGAMRFGLCRAKYKDGNLPVFTPQLDNMHVNISQAIKNIFVRGLNGVKQYNDQSYAQVQVSMKDQGYSSELEQSELMSKEEQDKIDDYLFNRLTDEMAEEANREAEAVIQDTYTLTDNLVEEYEASYDNQTKRILSRLKNQASAKKNK